MISLQIHAGARTCSAPFALRNALLSQCNQDRSGLGRAIALLGGSWYPDFAAMTFGVEERHLSSHYVFNSSTDKARIEALNGHGLTDSDLEFVLRYVGVIPPESKDQLGSSKVAEAVMLNARIEH